MFPEIKDPYQSKPGDPILKVGAQIFNNTEGTVIIHDLVNRNTKETCQYAPPRKGVPMIMDLHDRYGEQAVRNSDGVRRALQSTPPLLAIVTPELLKKWEALQLSGKGPMTLPEHLELEAGRVPRKINTGAVTAAMRRKRNKEGKPEEVLSPELQARIRAKVAIENEHDVELEKVREEVDQPISG